MTLNELFDLAADRMASDIHLATGETPRLRISGRLVPLDGPLDLPALLGSYLTPEGAVRLGAGLPFERTVVHGELAFNGVVFRAGDDGLAATFRVISKRIPPFEKVAEGAETFFRGVIQRRRGFVLIVGPTGSGKWTTASALVDAINAERADRIFVVTGHPSFLFESKLGLITQLHVGQDVDSYERALGLAHQADLDVLAMEEIPTVDALRQALSLAATGHLVIANLHAATPVEAVGRLLESARDEAPALRRALADDLIAVTAQRLLPRADGQGRVPLYEWIANTPTVREALLSGGDLARVQAEDPECRTSGVAARDLHLAGKIGAEEATKVEGGRLP